MQAHDPATGPARRPNWLQHLPLAGLLLFVGIVASLVWLTREYDAETQRTTLISDVLWMEQNLRFQLDRNEAQLQHIGPALLHGGPPGPQTEAQLQQLLWRDSGIERIVWLDAAGRIQGALPPSTDAHLIGESAGSFPSEALFRLAPAVGRPVYGPAYPVLGDKTHFEVHVPVWSESALLGVVVGVYSVSTLVLRELPWWFTERYRVAVLDPDGREIAAKSKVAALAPSRSYLTAFEPPGHGLVLQVTPYKEPVRWIAVLLIASLLLLAALTVWGLWQLRRQLLRRQAAEAALRGESAFRKAMEDSLHTGLRARDLDGRITYVNRAFCEMVGYPADTLVGLQGPMPYWHPDDLDNIDQLHTDLRQGKPSGNGYELRFVHRDGHPIDVLLFEAPLIDAHGRHTGWMGSVLDITAQKQALALARQQEERLAATSRLVAMGEMASSLAHELNQPLTAISSYTAGCLNQLERGQADLDTLRSVLGKLGRQAQRAGQIVRRVYDFVRRSEPKQSPVAPNDVVREAIGLIETDARRRQIRLSCELAEPLPEVLADPVMIEQVLINLIRNAIDAMHDTEPERREVHLSSTAGPGKVMLSVADRGNGIAADTAAQLFEPFFTTKAEGMGMGLNICRSIAELHGGRLTFAARPGGGTVFTLTLPERAR